MQLSGNVRVGVGPIGWVNDDLREWGAGTPAPQVMAEIARAGFAGTEMSYTFPKDPTQLKETLAGYNLVLAGAYRWVNFANPESFADEVEATKRHVDFCAAAGATVANVAEGTGSMHWDLHGERNQVEPLTEEGWKLVAEGLHAVGRYARERGIRLAIHPHAGTPIQYEDEIQRLFASTDPDLVGYCVDIGHIAYAGGDPLRVMRRHADRIIYVHAKDVRGDVLRQCHAEGLTFKQSIRRNCFCTPGAGSLDFDAIFGALAEAGFSGWLVVEAEQDPAVHNAFEVSARAREFIRRVAGV